jgi:hypothetical protein
VGKTMTVGLLSDRDNSQNFTRGVSKTSERSYDDLSCDSLPNPLNMSKLLQLRYAWHRACRLPRCKHSHKKEQVLGRPHD